MRAFSLNGYDRGKKIKGQYTKEGNDHDDHLDDGEAL